ncbi:MAG: copper homeostasis protein CutC [Haliscomenobacter sp.]
MLKEVCVDTREQALNAEAQGAQRIELCAHLDLDGLTPDIPFIHFALEKLRIPIHVMIRPRGGDFVYSDTELDEMKASILFCKENDVPGVVFGILKPDDTLDIDAIAELTRLAKPMKVVIHKAIDRTPDPVAALAQLLDIEGIDSVLTSGGAPTALQGAENLKKMIALAGDRLHIMVAGKVTQDNIEAIDQMFHAREYHGKLLVGPV